MHLLTSDIFAAIFSYFFFDDVETRGVVERSLRRSCTSFRLRSPSSASFCTTGSFPRMICRKVREKEEDERVATLKEVKADDVEKVTERTP